LNQAQTTLSQAESALTKSEAALNPNEGLPAREGGNAGRRREALRETQESLARKEEEARRLDAERAQLSTRFDRDANESGFGAATIQRHQEHLAVNAATVGVLPQLRRQPGETTYHHQHRSPADQGTVGGDAGRVAPARTGVSKTGRQMQELEKTRSELEKGRLAAETEKQRIAGQLLAAETEKRLTKEQLEIHEGRSADCAGGEGGVAATGGEARGQRGHTRGQIGEADAGDSREPHVRPEHHLPGIQQQPARHGVFKPAAAACSASV